MIFIWKIQPLSLYICASISEMKRQLITASLVIVLASCGRYSQVRELPQKDEMAANSRVYGEVEGPARQSKQTYPTPADAADRSVKIKDIMYGNGVAARKEAAAASATAVPADSAAKKDSSSGK
jgi:hypothetical protein